MRASWIGAGAVAAPSRGDHIQASNTIEGMNIEPIEAMSRHAPDAAVICTEGGERGPFVHAKRIDRTATERDSWTEGHIDCSDQLGKERRSTMSTTKTTVGCFVLSLALAMPAMAQTTSQTQQRGQEAGGQMQLQEPGQMRLQPPEQLQEPTPLPQSEQMQQPGQMQLERPMQGQSPTGQTRQSPMERQLQQPSSQQPVARMQAQPQRRAQQARPQRTIRNLRASIQGEANAAHRYDLFAQRAEQEGHPNVARLFRAAAVSERIHRRNHEDVLRSLGEPIRDVVPERVTVGTTRDNLLVPIQGEKEEWSQMYPEYIRQAQQENVPGAVQSFIAARDTEAVHDQLFQRALAQLGNNPSVKYYADTDTGMLITPTQQGTVAAAP